MGPRPTHTSFSFHRIHTLIILLCIYQSSNPPSPHMLTRRAIQVRRRPRPFPRPCCPALRRHGGRDRRRERQGHAGGQPPSCPCEGVEASEGQVVAKEVVGPRQPSRCCCCCCYYCCCC